MLPAPPAAQQDPEAPLLARRSSVTRGILLGVSGVLLINGYTHYIRHAIRAGELAIAHYPFLLFAGFLLLVFVIRPILLKVAPRFAPRLRFGRGLRQPRNS